MDSILFWIRIWANNFSAIGSKPIETKFRIVKSGATIHQVFHQKKTSKENFLSCNLNFYILLLPIQIQNGTD